jgi:ribosomal-protein-alanine N-acetyltransferase
VTTNYTLRYMRMEDVPQVLEVDKLSFPLPWSSRSYAFEINDNNSSHMITLEAAQEVAQGRGLMGALKWLRRSSPARLIAGYAGFWLIDGESHISTIAVHPNFRGRGLGEVILAGSLNRAIILKAEYSVLEVRVSNESALNLYRKYEYQVVGERKNYYRDNNEDAYLMHLAPLDTAYQQRFAERLEKLRQRVDYADLLGREK